MRVLVMYDVDTKSPGGAARLSRLAAKCLNWGIRIQNSVFQCEVNAMEYREMEKELVGMIDETRDNLRFYNLGNKFNGKIKVYGVSKTAEPDTFIL